MIVISEKELEELKEQIKKKKFFQKIQFHKKNMFLYKMRKLHGFLVMVVLINMKIPLWEMSLVPIRCIVYGMKSEN